MERKLTARQHSHDSDSRCLGQINKYITLASEVKGQSTLNPRVNAAIHMAYIIEGANAVQQSIEDKKDSSRGVPPYTTETCHALQ